MENSEGTQQTLSQLWPGFLNTVAMWIERLGQWLNGVGVPEEYASLAALVIVYGVAIIIVLVFILILLKVLRGSRKGKKKLAQETI